ncbi:hypothetical protein GCM10007962_26290 [Yeosuana aromativorans]|uniref:O-antigen ligase-related domain-containing protein n=1 Tax=Yeosuana aromativorans TaxID=288019 RepID=A0A8J3BR79_9FLAO|nr:O-antigen ligase family protein [Yeosuana aromativorans]GGK30678.1 hypothetical protein GCM10007962_26290 [Yeosuana aromativorans]
MNIVAKVVSSQKTRSLFLILVPITLIISIKCNSFLIIALIFLFARDIIYNFEKGYKKNKKLFLPPLLYVLSVLLGYFIDLFYNTNSIKTIERLLPFIVFPLIFFLRADNKFKFFDIIRTVSFVITCLNVLLILFASYSTVLNISKNQFLDESWIKSRVKVIIDPNQKNPINKKGVAKLIESSDYGSHDLVYKLNTEVVKDTNYIRSIFIKKAEREWVLIRQYDGISHKGIWFNVSKGCIGKKQDGLIGKIEKAENGWFKCTVINKTSKLAKTERLQLTIVDKDGGYKYKGNGKSGVYIWKGYLNQGNTIKNNLSPYNNFSSKEFFRENLLKPLDIHPTYYSVYLITAIIFFILALFKNFKKITLGLVIFNTLILILISSKGALLSFFLIVIFLGLINFKNQKSHFYFILLIFFLAAGSLIMIPRVSERIDQSIDTVVLNKNKNLSTSKRLIVWKSILNFDSKYLIFGKGNVEGEKLIKNKTSLKLNAHNQYLQALISSGVLGLCLLLFYLFSPLLFINDFKNELSIFTICLVILFSVNFMFESMLNRQWGIVYMSYLYSMIIFELKKSKF